MMAETDNIALRVRITGRVQGVWYRAWTCGEAQKRGIAGFVRNRLDGSVEALFKGEQAAVEELVARCWDGPPNAHVEDIETEEAVGVVAEGFKKLPTV